MMQAKKEIENVVHGGEDKEKDGQVDMIVDETVKFERHTGRNGYVEYAMKEANELLRLVASHPLLPLHELRCANSDFGKGIDALRLAEVCRELKAHGS